MSERKELPEKGKIPLGKMRRLLGGQEGVRWGPHGGGTDKRGHTWVGDCGPWMTPWEEKEPLGEGRKRGVEEE